MRMQFIKDVYGHALGTLHPLDIPKIELVMEAYLIAQSSLKDDRIKQLEFFIQEVIDKEGFVFTDDLVKASDIINS